MTKPTRLRAAIYVDGFNLYHAIDNLKQPHLKWLCLKNLSDHLTALLKHDEVVRIYYFSAYANHRPVDSVTRHKTYVQALKIQGVQCIRGKFKPHTVSCRSCGSAWERHEEKETDVDIALHIVRDAMTNVYDRAYIISSDSDLAPAFRMVKNQCPDKSLVSVAPPHKFHSKELVALADHKLALHDSDLLACQLPAEVYRADGKVFTRPLPWTRKK
jgi:uncharacterized LabA/DUF88 family protein